MTDSLRGRCELLVENQKAMRKHFKLEYSAIHTVCASIYASELALLNPNKIRSCLNLIKSRTAVFSQFRSVSGFPIATMLSLDKDANTQLTEALEVYSALRKEFAASAYLPTVAYTMSKHSRSAAVRARRIKEIYKKMRANHPFIVSSDDILYAALFAAHGYTIKSIEKSYGEGLACLKGSFNRNSIQIISNILLLGGGATKEKFTRVKSIYEKLKIKGFRYGKAHEMSLIATLALTDASEDELANLIIEVNDYLKQYSEFGWTMGQRLRLMHSALIICAEYSSTEKAVTFGSTVTGITSMILAQQASLAASISASASSVASNNITY